MSQSKQEGFLRAVLPSSGTIYVAVNIIDGTYKQRACNSIDEMLHYFATAGEGKVESSFGLASFKQGWYMDGAGKYKLRTQDNAQFLRTLWLDLDVGENKGYQSLQEAVDALSKFTQVVGLHKPYVVLSGGGLHVHYAMDRDLPAEEWQWIADRFHASTAKHALYCDRQRIRDTASVPRLPGSNNFKTGVARPVKLLSEGEIGTVESVVDIFSKYEPIFEVQKQSLGASMLSTDELGAVMEQIPDASLLTKLPPLPKAFRPVDAESVVAGCAQMSNQYNALEPVWRGMLGTLRHCEGGEALAHELSSLDPRYSKETTQEYLDALREKNIPPFACHTFRDVRPEICEACPHNGLIHSPISAGEKIEIAQVNEESVADEDATQENSEQQDLPDPYRSNRFRVNESGCYAKMSREDGSSYWATVYDQPIYALAKIRDHQIGEDPKISYVLRKHTAKGHDDVSLGGEVLMGNGFNGWMGEVGILLPKNMRSIMNELLIDMIRNTDLPETKLRNSLGWDRTKSSFLLGNKVYREDGRVINVNPKGKAASLSHLTQVTGDLETWKQIANVYNKKGMEWAQVCVLAGFASPLMSIGSLEQAAVIYLTGEAGAGKSTALMVCASIYGDPKQIMINKDDTYIARFEKLGMLNSVSAVFDEMTDMTAKEASSLAYQITQGRGKDRMGEGGRGLVQNTTSWSTLPVMSANDSIIEMLSLHSADSSAQMSRVMELHATNIQKHYTNAERAANDRMMRKLPKHFGGAGDVYIRYVVKNQEFIEKMIHAMEERFIKATGLTNSERFWTYMSVRLMVGMAIATKLGLIKYDVAGMFNYLADQSLAMRSRVAGTVHSSDTWLADFLNEHISSRIDVKTDTRPNEMADDVGLGHLNDLNYVAKPLGTARDLFIRLSLDDRRAKISKKALRSWCKRNHIGVDKFLSAMRQGDRLINENMKCDLGKGTMHRANTRTTCIEVSLSKEDMLGV